VDVINCDKFCDNLFKGLNFTGGKVPNFPIGIWLRRYNSAALPRSLWFLTGKSANRVNDNNKQVSKSLQRTWTQKLTDTNQHHYKPHSVSKILTFNQNKNHASSPKVLFTRVLLQKKTDSVSQSKKLALNISTGWHCSNNLPLSCHHYQLALFQSHSLQTYTECTQPCIVINQMIRLKVLTTIVLHV